MRTFKDMPLRKILGCLFAFALIIILCACSHEQPASPSQTVVVPTASPIVEGSVTIISGGEKLIPFKSWSHANYSNEAGPVVACAIQIQERGIEEELETIRYAGDFDIKIDGSPKGGPSYTTFRETFEEPYTDSSGLSRELVIPKEPGTYIVRVQVSWGEDDNSTAYDYVFKLLIE